MNRNDFEKRLRESDLDPATRWIAATYASHADWKTGEGIRVSQLKVAKETGYSRETVAKHTRNLEETGWLIRTGVTKDNVAKYDLGDPDEQEPELTQVANLVDNLTVPQVAKSVGLGCQDDSQVANLIDEVAKQVGMNYTEQYSKNNTMNNTNEERVPALPTVGGAEELKPSYNKLVNADGTPLVLRPWYPGTTTAATDDTSKPEAGTDGAQAGTDPQPDLVLAQTGTDALASEQAVGMATPSPTATASPYSDYLDEEHGRSGHLDWYPQWAQAAVAALPLAEDPDFKPSLRDARSRIYAAMRQQGWGE